MSSDSVLITRENGVGTVQFNRPDAMNSLDLDTKVALLAGLKDLGADPAVRCVVLTGSGRAFCVGQDLRQHVGLLKSGDLDSVWATVPEHYNPIALALHELEKPVIAAVNGVAAGAGASLAFLADYRIVSTAGAFNLAFAGVALSCDTGCSWTLPRLIGAGRSLDLLLNPRTISAAEAAELGIASEVVEEAEFADRVAALAAQLAAGPTLAYASMRQAVAYSATHPLAESLAFEAQMMQRTGASADHLAAVDAFLAKEKPTFAGR